MDQVSRVPGDEARAIEWLAGQVYEGITPDLGTCHVSDFYDAFYNQVVPPGWGVCPDSKDPAMTRAVDRVRQLDPGVERLVIKYMRRNYADRKGML